MEEEKEQNRSKIDELENELELLLQVGLWFRTCVYVVKLRPGLRGHLRGQVGFLTQLGIVQSRRIVNEFEKRFVTFLMSSHPVRALLDFQDNKTLEETAEESRRRLGEEKQSLEEKATFLHFTQEQLNHQIEVRFLQAPPGL